MLRKICNFILLCSILVAVTVDASTPMDRWQCSGEIQVSGDNRYQAFFLDDLIYRYAASDLSDLRITDQSGKFVPYLIQRGFETGKIVESIDHTILQKGFPKKNDLYFDFKVLLSGPNIDPVGSVLRFDLPNLEFLKEIEVLGSYDGKRWEHLAYDQLYRVQNLVKDEVDLGQSEKYSFYRIKVLNDPEQLAIGGLAVVDRSCNPKWSDFEKETKLKYSVKQESKSTAITLKNPNRLRIKQILIKADGNFKRAYQLVNGPDENIIQKTGEIYNFKFKDCAVSKTEIDLSGNPYSNPTLIVKITDNDDRPLKINEIAIKYYIDKIIFENVESKSYRLYVGNPEAVKPEYDLEHFQSYLEKEAQDLVRVENCKANHSARASEKNSQGFKLAFNIIIGVVAVLLIIFIVKKLNRDSTV